jgi:hypothetical protein
MGDVERALLALDVDGQVAGELLLGLRERTVGRRDDAVLEADGLRGGHVRQRVGVDELAGLVQLGHDRVDVAEQLGPLLLGQRFEQRRVVVDQQHVLHGVLLTVS